ncbi:MAG TPA: V-type ATP synthase subunit F [Vicinamibacteria bacterium]
MSRYWFRIVTRPGEGLGFRLAGAPVEEVEEGEVAARFRALLAEPGLGVLAVEEGLLKQAPEPLLERIGRDGVPVLFPFTFPGRWEEAGRGEQYVATLIRRAIGYHVKIQR